VQLVLSISDAFFTSLWSS